MKNKLLIKITSYAITIILIAIFSVTCYKINNEGTANTFTKALKNYQKTN